MNKITKGVRDYLKYLSIVNWLKCRSYNESYVDECNESARDLIKAFAKAHKDDCFMFLVNSGSKDAVAGMVRYKAKDKIENFQCDYICDRFDTELNDVLLSYASGTLSVTAVIDAIEDLGKTDALLLSVAWK